MNLRNLEIICIFAFLLFFGCVTPNEETQVPKTNSTDYNFSNVSNKTGTDSINSSDYLSNPTCAKIILGYCPTMQNIAKGLEQKNPNIALKAYGSTAEAISALKVGDVNSILVGRVVKKDELSDAKSYFLSNGSTLIYSQKLMIPENDLELLTIHTYLPKERAAPLFSPNQNIVFHPSLQSALESGEVALIDWADYSDEYELVIPYNDGGKVERFRIPALYSLHCELSDIY